MRFFFVFIALVLFSCRESYKNFNAFDDTVHYKLVSFSDNDESFATDEYIEISYSYCEMEACKEAKFERRAYSSVKAYSSFWNRFHLNDELIIVLDSMPSNYWIELFQLSNKQVYWPLISKVKLTKVIGNQSMIKDKAYDSLYIYREQQEIEKLKSDSSSSFFPKGGCYIDIVRQGKGDSVLHGREITLSYKAYFSDGEKFDDTDNWKDSIDFIYGQPFQLIPGLEAGIHALREGAEAKIIIPSQLAFGKQGSSSGIVPPFEPLLYNVKIISVKQVSL